MAEGRTRLFVRQLLTRPGSSGAIFPSSGVLAECMIRCAELRTDSVVAEYGPGTGVFTEHIVKALAPSQIFFAIEVNENFAAALRERFPGLHLYLECASRVEDCCHREGVDRVDRVISGLPWAIFPDDLQERILDAMIRVMPPGGVFVTFAYLQGLMLPAGRRFRRNLKRRFSNVETSDVIWLNLPPAVVYRCVR